MFPPCPQKNKEEKKKQKQKPVIKTLWTNVVASSVTKCTDSWARNKYQECQQRLKINLTALCYLFVEGNLWVNSVPESIVVDS